MHSWNIKLAQETLTGFGWFNQDLHTIYHILANAQKPTKKPNKLEDQEG